ncbi:MAG: V-type ATP synthase subunit I, partial [Bacteroides sp.]
MITKMKKITFLAYHKEYEEFLGSLRELGVVHVVEKQQGAADNAELQENIRLSTRLATTLKLLQNQKLGKGVVPSTDGGEVVRGHEVADEIEALLAEKNRLTVQLQTYIKERDALQAWGDFEPSDVQRLR